jgi:hypothetical protein
VTEKRFYQLCAGLPVVAPLVLAPVAALATWTGGRALGGIGVIVALFVWAPVPAGIPYLLFAAAVLWRLRAEPAEAYRRFSFVAPLLFAALLWVWFAVWLPPSESSLVERLVFCAAWAAFAVPMGYAYVALAHGLRGLLHRLGVVA